MYRLIIVTNFSSSFTHYYASSSQALVKGQWYNWLPIPKIYSAYIKNCPNIYLIILQPLLLDTLLGPVHWFFDFASLREI